MSDSVHPALELEDVSLRRSLDRTAPRQLLLDRVSWRVEAGEHWAVLGPNGAGKTTLLRIAAGRLNPSSGKVSILDATLGRVHLPTLRRRIAFAARVPALSFEPAYSVEDVVLTGVTSTTALLPEAITAAHRAEARDLMATFGVAHVSARPFVACSEGERARALIARSLVSIVDLLVLDEPGVGLDLPAREILIRALVQLHEQRRGLATIVATHHLEELPPTLTHVLLLSGGRVVASGPIERTLTEETARECFGIPVRIESIQGRLFARAR